MNELKIAILAQGAPLSHPHSLAYSVLTREVRKKGKVLITGEGADELFYGYDHYQNTCGTQTFGFREHININNIFEKSKSQFDEYLNNFDHLVQKLKLSDLNNRDLDIKTHLLSLLRRNDRISMANSVELRSAYLDPELFAIITNLQIRKKLTLNKLHLVSVINKLYPEFKEDPKKIGFYIPFDKWWIQNYPNQKLKYYINNALNYINMEFGFKVRDHNILKGKLAWILLNIGIFMSDILKINHTK